MTQSTGGAYMLGVDEGRAVWFVGSLMLLKAPSGHAGEDFSFIDQRVPGGYSVPLHLHRSEDEAWYVLEGDATFYCGDEQFTAGPGAWVFLPRNVPHTFKVGASGGRLLTFTNSAGFGSFAVEAGEPAPALTVPPPAEPDVQRLAEAAARYGIEIVGPPVQ